MEHEVLPAPPRPDQPRITRVMAPLAASMAVIAAWFFGEGVAARRLGFVPVNARVYLATGWVVFVILAIAAMHLRWTRQRIQVVGVLAAVAFLTPIVGTIFVPSLDQLPRTPFPGGVALAISASPTGNANLYLLRDGGAQIVRITDTAAAELMPELSSDGRRIVYVSDVDGTRDLHVMELDALDRAVSDRQITHSYAAEQEPHWSADGSKIVFSVMTGSGVDIAVIDADGSHLRYLTDDHTSMNPDWSPDGHFISFTRPAPEPPADDDIWMMRADGSHAHDVVSAPGPQWGAAWSPDGRSFDFTAAPDGNEDVMLARTDGSGLRDLTQGSSDRDEAIGWTPDGHVLFLSDRAHTGGTFLYFMQPDGSGVHLSVIL